MSDLQKKIVSAALIGVVLAGAAFTAQKQPQTDNKTAVSEKETPTVPQKDTDSGQPQTNLICWYQDPAYGSFLELAAERYFEKTGITIDVQQKETLDYIGDIYDATMQDASYPDIYMISADNLEEAYLYGLTAPNTSEERYQEAAAHAIEAVSCREKILGYPLSYNTCLFVYQNGYFQMPPESMQAIIDYSNQNEPEKHVKYLLEWDVNDAFYDFAFISNSVRFEQKDDELQVVYDEELYQKDLDYFEKILDSFSVDAQNVSEDSIVENFLAGRTLCAILDSNSLAKLGDYSYSLMEIPDLNEELTTTASAITDVLAVNDFSAEKQTAADFAEFVTVDMAPELYPQTGRYSVFCSKDADEKEKTAWNAYETAVLAPDARNAKDFWVELKETIVGYFQ